MADGEEDIGRDWENKGNTVHTVEVGVSMLSLRLKLGSVCLGCCKS